MIVVFRLLWALFLSGLVAFAFHRSWRWEHGGFIPVPLFGDTSRYLSKDTVVWVTPLIFPILIIITFVLLLLLDKDINHFFLFVLDVMLTISVYFLALFLLLPVLRRSFSARACATLWLLPVFLFYQLYPLIRTSSPPLFFVYIPGVVLRVCSLLLMIGFSVIFVGKIISHLIFRREMLKDASPVTEPEVIVQWQDAQKWAEYYRPIRLLRSPAAKAPFSMGRTIGVRVTVLPERDYTAEELRFIFRHELCHIQRKDVDTKIFLAFCQALCWFNPLVWAAIRKASADLELSCDEQVLQDCSEEERKQYASLLLRSAGHARGFTTCLSAAAQSMRYRLRNVINVRRRRPGTLLLGVFMFVFTMAFGILSVSTDRRPAVELFETSHVDSRLPLIVQSVSYHAEGASTTESVWAWDEEKLLSILSQLDVERMGWLTRPEEEAQTQQFSLRLSRGSQSWWVTCWPQHMTVWSTEDHRTMYYHLPSPPDWAAIRAALDFEAEEPQTSDLLDPHLYFKLEWNDDSEILASDEPFFLLCRSLWVQDAETGEVLRVRGRDDSSAGFYGEPFPIRARLAFDLPVAQIMVSAQEPDGTVTEPVLSREGGQYTLDLLPRPATYTISILSKAQESLIYTGTYAFEVHE